MLPYYAVTLIILSQILQLLNYIPPIQAPVQMMLKEQNQQALIGMTLLIGVIGPFFEEIMFRGLIYRVARDRVGVWRAMIATSLLFAIVHGHVAAFIPIFVLGITLNYLYEKTHSIIPGAVMHATHNAIMIGATLSMKGLIG